MHIPWVAREYERTCQDCDHAWAVPKWAARPRMHGLTFVSEAGGSTAHAAAVVAANAAVDEKVAVFRLCPECGSARYRQRPVRLPKRAWLHPLS
jgi:hypothetical protein